ncbi:MAG: HipA N-terminal domain-containing protein [Sandaracinus sp.]
MSTELELEVRLGADRVGALALGASGERSFRFDPAYDQAGERRVLGQWFEDQDRQQPFVGRESLPHFFGNLLPQGELKKYLLRELGLLEGQDFHLLAALGGDLPGAVRVVPPAEMPVERTRMAVTRRPKTRPEVGVEHYFSLAGMQLKFSMMEVEGKLTLPSKTDEGRFIVKLPDVKMPGVPETEMAMLDWARASGVRTVDARLEPVSNLRLAFDDLPR